MIKTKMGAGHSQKVGRDSITRENTTHVEVNTRHVYAKTEGFRLFDIHNEGSGGAHTGLLAGFSGIGLVGEVLIALCLLVIVVRALRKWQEKRIRHDNYKRCYRERIDEMSVQRRSPYPAITASTKLPPTRPVHKKKPDLNIDIDTE